MKRRTAIAIVSALAVGGSASAAISAAGGSAARPSLRIVDTNPLTVRGANFRPGEAITVNAVVRQIVAREVARQKRLLRSGTAGGFTVALRSIEIEGCAMISVTATGASGDSAVTKLMPECAAP